MRYQLLHPRAECASAFTLLKPPSTYQLRSPFKAPLSVHLQQPDGGASCGGQPTESDTVHSEVRLPRVPPRMEQRDDIPRVGIDGVEVCAFVAIAAMAGPSQILQDGPASMLAGQDVFEMKRLKGWPPVWQATILAAPARPLPDCLPQGLVHSSGAAVSWRSALRRSVATMSPNSMKRSYSCASSDVSWPSLAF